MQITGIYQIKNLITNDFYVGSSLNISKRIQTHLKALRKNKYHSRFLQRAWNKYKEENFVFEYLEQCLESEILILEQSYIDTLNPKYNVSKFATAFMKGRKHSKKTRNLFSKQRIGNKYTLGIKWSEAQRQKIMDKKIASKRSNETKQKMSDTAIRINSISRVDRTKQRKRIIDSNGIIYESLSSAAKILKMSIQAICDNLKGRSKTSKTGLAFKYENS